jgi:hypothetical protein
VSEDKQNGKIETKRERKRREIDSAELEKNESELVE